MKLFMHLVYNKAAAATATGLKMQRTGVPEIALATCVL
jgi:hypothetical protein